MTDVTVIDYDCGNLFSVCRASEISGRSFELTSDPDKIAHASRLILPGVGAFSSAKAVLGSCCLVAPDAYMYFVHSFVSVPSAQSDILAVAQYDALELCAAVPDDNVTDV